MLRGCDECEKGGKVYESSRALNGNALQFIPGIIFCPQVARVLNY